MYCNILEFLITKETSHCDIRAIQRYENMTKQGGIWTIFLILHSLTLLAGTAHIKYVRDEDRKCNYCKFYAEERLSPYELLWTVAAEISPILDDEDRQPMLMNPEDLRIAENAFEAYCEQFCQ